VTTNIVSSATTEEAADECRARGGAAIAIPTDTTDVHAVQDLADGAAERFGGIDVWVNNAGLSRSPCRTARSA
jgi:NAD(P)-dependent dehydrogenase (short-subunit alcohol dehydrogenase family)